MKLRFKNLKDISESGAYKQVKIVGGHDGLTEEGVKNITMKTLAQIESENLDFYVEAPEEKLAVYLLSNAKVFIVKTSDGTIPQVDTYIAFPVYVGDSEVKTDKLYTALIPATIYHDLCAKFEAHQKPAAPLRFRTPSPSPSPSPSASPKSFSSKGSESAYSPQESMVTLVPYMDPLPEHKANPITVELGDIKPEVLLVALYNNASCEGILHAHDLKALREANISFSFGTGNAKKARDMLDAGKTWFGEEDLGSGKRILNVDFMVKGFVSTDDFDAHHDANHEKPDKFMKIIEKLQADALKAKNKKVSKGFCCVM